MSEHKANKQVVTVVETQTPGKRFRAALPSRRKLVTALVVLAVLALAGFGIAKAVQNRQATQEAERQAQANKPKRLADKEYDKAQDAAFNDPKGSLQLAQEQADDSVKRQMMLASAYANDGQYDKSLEIFDQQIARDRLAANHISGAAEIARQAKQKDRAVKYYQQAIEKAKQEKGVTSQDSITYWESAIKELQK